MAEEKDQPELSDETRKEIYKKVCQIQRELPQDDPNYRTKLQEAYPAVAKEYELSEDEVRQICIEGATKHWASM